MSLYPSHDFGTATGEKCCLLSRQHVILKHVVTHCFEHSKPLQLMSCSLLVMVLLFRTGYCCFLSLHFINFCFCFENTNTVLLRLFHLCQQAILVLAAPSSARVKRGGLWWCLDFERLTRSKSAFPKFCLESVYSLANTTHCMLY